MRKTILLAVTLLVAAFSVTTDLPGSPMLSSRQCRLRADVCGIVPLAQSPEAGTRGISTRLEARLITGRITF